MWGPFRYLETWAALSRGAFSRFHGSYNAIHGYTISVLIIVVRSFIFHTTVMLSYIFKWYVQLSLHAFFSIFAIYPPWKRNPVTVRRSDRRWRVWRMRRLPFHQFDPDRTYYEKNLKFGKPCCLEKRENDLVKNWVYQRGQIDGTTEAINFWMSEFRTEISGRYCARRAGK